MSGTMSSVKQTWKPWVAAFLLACWIAPCLARETDTVLEGTIFDLAGSPIPGCRIVVQAAGGTEVFLSPPSAEDGHYRVPLPSGDSYVIMAAISPTGGRASVPDRSLVQAVPGTVTRDIYLFVSARPGPRHAAKALGGSDRLFLALIEDPLLAERQRWEFQAAASDFDIADRIDGRFIGAFQFPMLPRVEFGARAGFADLDVDGGASGSGATDLDLWTKFHMHRSTGGALDLAVGGLFTLPTGDDAEGLGHDALQSKLFFAMSYSYVPAVVVAHVGLRTTEDGSIAGTSLDGKISLTAAASLIVPFSSKLSLAVEANYEGERFEGADADSRVLLGINWRPHLHGTLRAAVAGGLTDGAPDVQALLGYAFDF